MGPTMDTLGSTVVDLWLRRSVGVLEQQNRKVVQYLGPLLPSVRLCLVMCVLPFFGFTLVGRLLD